MNSILRSMARPMALVTVWLFSAATLLFSGCGNSSRDFVFTTTSGGLSNNSPPGGTTTATFNVSVAASPGALTQIPVSVTQVRVTLFDINTANLGQKTDSRGATVVFPDTASGQYLVRFEGLDANGNVIGFFDRVITVNNQDLLTLIPGLRLTTPPSASFPQAGSGSPFFIFTASPTAAVGATAFSVSAQVFDAQGNPVTAAVNSVALSSSDINFDVAPATQDTDTNGSVTFNNVAFPFQSAGTTTLTVSAGGVTSATTPEIAVSAAPPFFATIELLNLTNAGAHGNSSASSGPLSTDGRFFTFSSPATDLVDNDTNGFTDVFVFDRQTNTMERVSISSAGDQGNGISRLPDISGDGRFVCFESLASNLVPNDTNGELDVFVYDRTNDTVSIIPDNSHAGLTNTFTRTTPSISENGLFVAFAATGPSVASDNNVFVRDLTQGTTELVSRNNAGDQGNSRSESPSISADGNLVAFVSLASNLVPGDLNANRDVFVYNRNTDTIERVSVDSTGAEGNSASLDPKISGDGRFVVFTSFSSNLVAGDTNGTTDVFTFDRTNTTLECNSLGGDGLSERPDISADGRFVVYSSASTNLVAGDTNSVFDIFLRDRATNQLERVSVSDTGQQADGASSSPFISSDGRRIVFATQAANLVAEDTDAIGDPIGVVNPFRR